MHELTIECSKDLAEELSDFLDENECLSITFTDKQDDPILEPDIGTTPLWPNVIVHVIFSDEKSAQNALTNLGEHYPKLPTQIQMVPEQDWERAWMDNFVPMQFGERLWVCPSSTPPPVPEACNLILDPGLAFGTGTHPTTALCLKWLDHAKLTGKDIIDYGCGSGILSVAALKLGAHHVTAIDIDNQALIATKNNAEVNSISEAKLTIALPEQAKVHQADIIVANILLSPLLSLKEDLHQYLKPEGTLVVSGILAEQVELLTAAYKGLFKHQETLIEDEWARIELTKA